MEKSQISIIIPVYNSNETIRRAVLSAINQTYANKQIILVDDGSKQNCMEVLKDLSSHFTLITQTNKGAGGARNTAALHANGELLAFLDSDDTWHPQKLEIQSQIFEKFPDTSLCSTLCKTIDEAHSLPLSLDESRIENRDMVSVFQHPFMITSTVMMKKRDFESMNGFDEGLITAEDADLYFKVITSAKRIIRLNMPLTFSHLKPDSLSSHHRAYLDYSIVLQRYAPNSEISKECVDSLLIENFSKMGGYCIWRRDFKGASIAIQKLLAHRAYNKAFRTLIRFPLLLRNRK